MFESLAVFSGLTLHAALIGYGFGMMWTFLSWIRTIHETQSRSKMAADRRDKNLANALRQSARDTYTEGMWVILFWPLVVVRNFRTVLEVRHDVKARKQAEKTRR